MVSDLPWPSNTLHYTYLMLSFSFIFLFRLFFGIWQVISKSLLPCRGLTFPHRFYDSVFKFPSSKRSSFIITCFAGFTVVFISEKVNRSFQWRKDTMFSEYLKPCQKRSHKAIVGWFLEWRGGPNRSKDMTVQFFFYRSFFEYIGRSAIQGINWQLPNYQLYKISQRHRCIDSRFILCGRYLHTQQKEAWLVVAVLEVEGPHPVDSAAYAGTLHSPKWEHWIIMHPRGLGYQNLISVLLHIFYFYVQGPKP